MTEKPSEDALIASLLARLEHADPQREPVDANLLAGLLDGSLSEDERAAVLEELRDDPEGLREAAALFAATAPEIARPRWSRRRLLGAAGATAAASVLGLWWWQGSTRSSSEPEPPDLASTLDRLIATDPAQLAGLREAEAADEAVLRHSGIQARAPIGSLETARPSFEWSGTTGSVELRVMRPDGVVLLTARTEGARLDFPGEAPDLAPGTYLWLVEQLSDERRSPPQDFRVLDPDARDSYRRARRWIEQNAPAAHRPAARAQLERHFGIRSPR